MTAPRITAEEIARFRKSNASLGCLYENDADDILDALESAYAELDRLRSAPVAVEVPETDVAMIRRCLDECAWDDILQPIVDWTDRMSDALRSGEAEGRMG